MAAIITDHFRRNQARLLVNDIKASADSEFDSTANSSSNSNESNWPYRGNNRYSIGLGKSDSWPDAGTVTEASPSFVVPAPAGNRQEDEDVINNLFTLKDVSTASAKQMIAKNPWTSGRKYKVYDSADPDAFYATGELYPCYVTHNNSVYIVLSNTAIDTVGGFSQVLPSTTAPSTPSYGISASPTQGYVWCEVAKIPPSDGLITNQFVPIRRNSELSGTTDVVSQAQRKLTAGLLSHVGVISGGSGYSTNTAITATIVGHSGNILTNPGITFTPIIVGGVIQRVDIRDPQNSPTNPGSYEFWDGPDPSDAQNLVASTVAHANRIKSVTLTVSDAGTSSSEGSGEGSSESGNGGTGAVLSATIAPATGYAHNAINVLPTWFVGINVNFIGEESDKDAPALKFRQVSLLKNFVRSTDSNEASGSESKGTLDALKSITLHTPQSSALGNLTTGQILYQKGSNAKFYYDYHVTDSGTTTLFYHQNSDGEINTADLDQGTTGTDNAIGTGLGGSQISNGVSAVNAPEYRSRIASGTALGDFNGEVIFHENRKPFTRSSTQTEEVKLIIQL